MRHTESEAFSKFVSKLVAMDENSDFSELIWSQFSSTIRVLLDNKLVYQPFWDYQNGKISETDWKNRFSSAKLAANNALSSKKTDVVICIILQRLYTLRNQIVHGGGAWNSTANREQIRDGVAFLSKLVPIIINVMMDNTETLWGDANYPLISE
ncbi:HEPN domain-containing protein [Shewanella psychrotolerans]|uniref:HEPN domain-containing protein n=1 Tax=Shewanella psychrotolerans TaxID=2864206 RepID=UPI00331406C9